MILFAQFDFWQSLIVTVMLALYIVFTYRVTEWRTALRRSMNELQNQANNRYFNFSLFGFFSLLLIYTERPIRC